MTAVAIKSSHFNSSMAALLGAVLQEAFTFGHDCCFNTSLTGRREGESCGCEQPSLSWWACPFCEDHFLSPLHARHLILLSQLDFSSNLYYTHPGKHPNETLSRKFVLAKGTCLTFTETESASTSTLESEPSRQSCQRSVICCTRTRNLVSFHLCHLSLKDTSLKMSEENTQKDSGGCDPRDHSPTCAVLPRGPRKGPSTAQKLILLWDFSWKEHS